MGDTGKILLEDMIVYVVFGVMDLLWDFAQNIFFVAGLSQQRPPYIFGTYQALVLLFCAIQFARKANQWRYYK